MSDKQFRILVSRQCGGLGDQLCCLVPLRAIREKYPDAHITYAVGDPYLVLLYDQKEYADSIISFHPWGEVYESQCKKFDLLIQLDGPEVRYAVECDYDLKESRIETWVRSADAVPSSWIPRWTPQPWERQKVAAYLQKVGLRTFNFVVVQYKAAEPKKDYEHTASLVEELKRRGYNVVVAHNDKVDDLGVPVAEFWDPREIGCLLELASFVIGPDSAFQHFAAAVSTPSIGLFGPTNPELYLKHYPLASYLWNKNVQGKECEKTFPCQGLRYRNWWCRTLPGDLPWCLGQISPTQVCDSLDTRLKILKDQNFYEDKLHHICTPGSEMFFIPDARVNLMSAQEVAVSKRIKGLAIR